MTNLLQETIDTIIGALDACESVLSAGFFESGTNERSWVIPQSRHDKNVRVVLANAVIALELAGRR